MNKKQLQKFYKSEVAQRILKLEADALELNMSIQSLYVPDLREFKDEFDASSIERFIGIEISDSKILIKKSKP